MELPQDPFNNLDLDQSKISMNYKGKRFEYFTPPYFPIEDQVQAKNRILDTYSYKEMLFIHGYSGCGKTTILTQLAQKDPKRFILIESFSSLTTTELLRFIAKAVDSKEHYGHLGLKDLSLIINQQPNIMLLVDEVSANLPDDRKKLEILRHLHDETRIPIILTGVNYVYSYIMQENHDKYFCSLKTRLRDCQMKGMTFTDASNYLEYLSETENIEFTYLAIQALIDTALNHSIGGINAMTKILGKCITTARAAYYMDGEHKLPDSALYIRPENPEGTRHFGERKVIELPKTPVSILIDEYLVATEQERYRSDFPQTHAEQK